MILEDFTVWSLIQITKSDASVKYRRLNNVEDIDSQIKHDVFVPWPDPFSC